GGRSAHHANGPRQQQAMAASACNRRALGRESPSRPLVAGRVEETPMLDPERLLGQMLSGALGGALGGKRRARQTSLGGGIGGLLGGGGAARAQLGIGLLGIAVAAWEHYASQPKAAGPDGAPAAAAPQRLTGPPP